MSEIVFKKESNSMQGWNIVALAGGYTYHWPAQKYVYLLYIFGLFELSLAEWNFVSRTYLTQLVTEGPQKGSSIP